MTALRPLFLASFGILALLAPAHAAEPEHVTYGDWTYLCKTVPEKKTQICEIVQAQTIDQGGKKGRLLQLSLGKQDNGVVMLALLPLGITIPSGAAVKVDENEQKPMTLTRCTAAGCEALLKVDDSLITQMKKGKELKIGFNAGAKTIIIPASLKGFSNAISALTGKPVK